MPDPNNAQQEMQGRLTKYDIKTRNNMEINKLSSLGKNKDTAVPQITQAFGLTNWKIIPS